MRFTRNNFAGRLVKVMNWDHMQGWNHMGGWGVFGMILFWGLIIFGVVFLFRYVTQQRSETRAPLDVLKKRYARGEISKEEYEKTKKDLAA